LPLLGHERRSKSRCGSLERIGATDIEEEIWRGPQRKKQESRVQE
jgi:hypothetical protein